MSFYQKLITNRRKGGSIYIARQRAEECHRLCPDDDFIRDECRYWKYVYWMTGEVTQRLGMDAKREQRIVQNIPEICGYSPEDSSVRIGGMHLFVDDPALCRLIIYEYSDICVQDVYYQNQYPEYRLDPSKRNHLAYFGNEGPYETESVQLHPDDIVIDCGANMGIFSILAVQRGAKTVYAFDPQKRALRLLDANIKSNGCEGKILPVPFGLSDNKCSISFVEDNENIGGSRISREDDTATTTIECTTLDDWVTESNIPRIDFIKADIEGAERDMLNGARKTIKRDHPRLAICTYHLPDDPQVLRDIILSIDPSYHIDQREKKLYAW